MADKADIGYEDKHRIAIARELTYAAGCPLRDRYGFAASDEDVLTVVNIVFGQPDDKAAGDAIGLANAVNDIEIAEAYDTPASEEYEQMIIAALRPLVADRRAAEDRHRAAMTPKTPALVTPRQRRLSRPG